MSVVLMGDNGCNGCVGIFGAFSATANPLPRTVTGTDGSQTGTASFTGNFTAIAQPSQNYFVLQRRADCTLTLMTALRTSAGQNSLTGNTDNYERTLHRLASINTTADVYPNGCVEKNTGISSRPAIWLGYTKQNLGLAAAVLNYNGTPAVFTGIVSTSRNSVDLEPRYSFPYAAGLATSDFDGDGNNDLVIVNGFGSSSPNIAVALTNADGTLKTPVTYGLGGTGYAVSALIDDVNGDGKLDIVAVASDQTMSVLLGKGDGTFSSAQSFAAKFPGTAPTSVGIQNMVTADLRGNGRRDIVCSNGLVLLSNGDGTFTAQATAAFPYTPSGTNAGPFLAAGDLNKDGKQDIVESTGYAVFIWNGKGDGTFNQGKGYAAINTAGYVTVSDLDGDGNLDIYLGLANGGLYSGDSSAPATAYVLLGNGDGSFQGAEQGTFAYNGHNLGDVNGDGQQDIITVGTDSTNTPTTSFTVQLGTPAGTFQTSSTITTPATFVNNGRTYSTAGTTVSSYVVADINGDGKADLVYLLSGVYSPINGPFYFTALSNGDGTFATPVAHDFPTLAPSGSFDANLTVDGLQIADFNRDGKADLLFTYSEQTSTPGSSNQPYLQGFAVLPGAGNATFGTPVTTQTYNSANPTVLFPPEVGTIVDLNGDGNPDLLVVARNGSAAAGFGSELRLYLGNADGTFKAPTVITTASNPRVISYPYTPYPGFVVADFNKDGKLDLAVLGETTAGQAQLAISLGNGNGTFGAPVILNVSGGDAIRSSTLAVADFDRDGNLDLALADANSFSGVFYGKGDGTFVSVPSGNVFPKDLLNLYAGGAAVALDLNKDGKPDLLVGSTVFLSNYGSAPAITLATSTTVLTTSGSPVVTGTNVTLTATVTGASGVASGSVTFTDSLGGAAATTLGTATLNGTGVATISTTTLAIGTHIVTATYSGSGTYSASTSTTATIVVTAPAAVASTTTLAAAPTSTTLGQAVALTATVTGSAGVAAGTVTFSDSLGGAAATTLGTGTLNASGVAMLSTTALAVGTHAITVMYGGSAAYLASTSAAVTVIVATAPVPDFAIALSSTSGSVKAGTTAATTVTVTPVNGFAQAVSFSCAGLPSTVTCSFSPLTVTPAGAPASTTLTFTRTATASIVSATRGWSLAIVGVGLGWAAMRRKRRLLPLLGCLLLTAATGCFRDNSTLSTPNPVTSTVTITATSGSLTHSMSYTLTSQ